MDKIHSKLEKQDAGFRGTVFPERILFKQTFIKADFSEAVFSDKAEFMECVFLEIGDFSYATFLGPAIFAHSVFPKTAEFRDAKFSKEANFWGAQFGKESSEQFDNADFFMTVFEGDAHFGSAKFYWGVSFSAAKFLQNADFRETLFRSEEIRMPGEVPDIESGLFQCRFEGKVNLERIRIKGTLSFQRAEFGSALFVRGPFYTAAIDEGDAPPPTETIPRLRFEYVFFDEPEKVRFQNLHLGETTFRGTNIRHAEFRNVIWPKKLVSRKLINEPGRVPPKRSAIARKCGNTWRSILFFLGHNTTADEWCPDHSSPVEWPPYVVAEPSARQVCRDLKANLEDQRDYAAAGDFYYAEMELRRRQLDPVRTFLYWLYWLTCGYGEKPLRAFFVLLCFCVVLTIGFMNTWFTPAEHVSWRTTEYVSRQAFRPQVWEALGHAARSLTLQQRGSYLTPYTPWANHLTLVANLLGPVQFGLFILAMRRRFRR